MELQSILKMFFKAGVTSDFAENPENDEFLTGWSSH